MAYIGKQPLVGNYQKCDAITVVNGQAAYTLQVNSSNVVPQTATNMIVSLNSVIQAPIDSYTVSGSTITFDSNLATGDVIDFIVILGDVLDIGVPTDGTVTNAKLTAGSFTNITTVGTLTTLEVSGDALLPEGTLTDGATISWDVSASPVAKVTLAGARTISAPSNPAGAGQFISLLVIQDGTGTRTLTWNAIYEFTADTAPTLTTTASKGDLFTFRYNGTKWLEVGRNLNLSLS